MQETTVGARLAAARALRRLNPEDVARRVKISRPTLWRYETDRTSPTLAALVKLCELYGVKAHWIVTGEGEP